MCRPNDDHDDDDVEVLFCHDDSRHSAKAHYNLHRRRKISGFSLVNLTHREKAAVLIVVSIPAGESAHKR